MAVQSLVELEEKEQALFALFHPMPNNEERARLYREWLEIRRRINADC